MMFSTLSLSVSLSYSNCTEWESHGTSVWSGGQFSVNVAGLICRWNVVVTEVVSQPTAVAE